MRRAVIFLASVLTASSLSAQGRVGEPQRLGALPREHIVYPFAVENLAPGAGREYRRGKYYPFENLAPVHSDFASYSTSPVAMRGARTDEFFYKPVTSFTVEKTDSSTIYTATVELSARWLGRSTRIHTEGSRRVHLVWINAVFLGYSTDASLPSEFLVGTTIVEHQNTIKIEVLNAPDPVSNLRDERPALTDVYLYSQPMTHIADYELIAEIDSLGKGHFLVGAQIANDYNLNKPVAVGCILTTLDGRSIGYGPIEKYVAEHSYEQIVFDIEVDKPKFWTPASPTQYQLLLYVKYMGQIVEYVPIKAAFRNQPTQPDITQATGFNATEDHTATIKQLAALKKQGKTLLAPDAPQPSWLYYACDSLGMTVIDCANIYASATINNSPEFAAEYERRVETMYLLTCHHPCIVAWRIADADIGTAYALWRAKLKLEQLTK